MDDYAYLEVGRRCQKSIEKVSFFRSMTNQKEFLSLEEIQEIYDALDKGTACREDVKWMLRRKFGAIQGTKMYETIVFGRD